MTSLDDLSEDERDTLRDWWDEDTTVGVESAFPIIARIIAARTRAVEQERDKAKQMLDGWQKTALQLRDQHEHEFNRAEAAEQRVAELEAAVLALADEWDAHSDRMHDEAIGADRDAAIVLRSKSGTYAVNAERLSALVSDPTRRDRR